jgi:hypothetical protein
VTPCVVERRPFPNQIRRESTAYPLNSVEYALHIKVGDPKWANYGIIRLIIGINRKTGKPNPYLRNIFKPEWPPQHDKHPFNKPVPLYVHLLKCFSKPEHSILEAFAGTCTSVEACFELGRNLVLVEKDPQQKKLFQERVAVTRLKLAQMGGEDEDAETQAQPLVSTVDMVEGSNAGTARNPKKRLTPEIRASSKKSRTESVLSQPIVEDEEEEQDEEEGEQYDEEEEQYDEEEEDDEENDSDKDSYGSVARSDDSSDKDFDPKEKSVEDPVITQISTPPIKPGGKKPAAPNPPKPRAKEKRFVSLTDLAKKKIRQQKE